jgi:hypothetical protein
MVSSKELFPRTLLSVLEAALLFIIVLKARRIVDFAAVAGSDTDDPRKLAVV